MFRFKTGQSKSVRVQRGFSIVELTVVLLVIVIVVAFVVPQVFNYIKRYRVSVAARNVATAVQRARFLATSDNKRAGVVILTEAQRLDIEEYDPEGLQEPSNRGTVYLPQGITISEGAPRQIAFDGRGVVTPLPRESPVIRVNGEDGYYAVITVSPTGQVTIGDMTRGDA
jgi:prepilin-type N-terminal cleavage/methylation domain-containing protein